MPDASRVGVEGEAVPEDDSAWRRRDILRAIYDLELRIAM
jgi:hypothetical protein